MINQRRLKIGSSAWLLALFVACLAVLWGSRGIAWAQGAGSSASRAQAERIYADGRSLEKQGTAESLRNALAKYEEASRLYRTAGDRRGEGDALHRLGLIRALLGENSKALEHYQQALPLIRAAGDRGGEAATLNDIGAVYYRLGERQKALDYYDRALPLIRAAGDHGGEAMLLTGIGLVHEAQGEKQQALEHYQQALALSRSVGDRSVEATILNRIGWVHDSEGEKQQALEYYNQALPLWRAVGDRGGEATTLTKIGAVYHSLGDRQQALDYYHQSLPCWRAAGDRVGEAATLNNIGAVDDALGEKQQALDYYQQALALSRTVGDRSREAATLNNIGWFYDLLGEKQKAADHYHQALVLWRAVGDRGGEAATLNGIGLIYDSLGEKRKALEYFHQALPLERAVGDRGGEATTLNNIGLVYHFLAEREKALEYYGQALALSRTVGDRTGEATTLTNLGAIHYSLAEEQQALDCYRQALALSRAVGDLRREAIALLGIARAEAARGKLLEAREPIESALKIIESLRTNYSPEWRSSYFATTQDYYEFRIELLMRLHQLDPARGYELEALQTAERARARSLLESLVEARLEIRSGADPDLIERERKLRELLSARSERQIVLLNGRHTEQQAAAMAGEIRTLTAEYQEVESEIRARSPRYAALTQPQPLKPEEIQRQVLDDQTLLLEYFLGKERSYLWVVSADRVRSYELPKREEIEELALSVKTLLTARVTREKGESVERRQARIAGAEARYPEEAGRLSRMILPFSELGGKRLAIVPDGELQEVAFGALPAPQAGSKENREWLPLIAEHEIVSLPSASALAVLRRETAGREPAPKALAVLADPVFEKDDGRLMLAHAAGKEDKKEDKEDKTESESLAGRDLLRALREAMGEEMVIPRLLSSRMEAEAILSLTPKTASLRALDFKASRETATSGELSHYRIVHFATHGFLNMVHPELSGIVLSLIDREGKKQNGFLQLHDVYNLNLPAELVVLSACQTGLGKSVRGEGLVGLTRGFMYAGAKRVVASLWRIDDLGTAELMKRYYGAMLGERKLSPAEALRAAQMEMWKEKRWRSPYYWGGFVLYGEWDGLAVTSK